MDESEKELSFTRVAPSTSGRAQKQIPISISISSSRRSATRRRAAHSIRHTPTGDPIHDGTPGGQTPPREIPAWEGRDTLVSKEVIEVGPDCEKVDVMTFRGSFERDVKAFTESDPDMKEAVEAEKYDAVETIMNERF